MHRWIGDPSIFSVGDPTIFVGLPYWLHKWLPDPPPEVRDALIASQIWALASFLSDADARAEVQKPVAKIIEKQLAG
jgi:hypothetical protein